MIISGHVLLPEQSIDISPAQTPVIDLSRYHTNGTVTGTVLQQLPSGLWIRYFTNDNINFGTPPHLTIPGALTIWVWFYSSHIGQYDALLSKGDSAGIAFNNYIMRIKNTDYLEFLAGRAGGGYSYRRSTINVRDGLWHLGIGVLDGTIMRQYLDGVTNPAASTANAEPYYTSADNCTVGRWDTVFGTCWIGGYGISNFAWSHGQARNYYEKTKHLYGRFD